MCAAQETTSDDSSHTYCTRVRGGPPLVACTPWRAFRFVSGFALTLGASVVFFCLVLHRRKVFHVAVSAFEMML